MYKFDDLKSALYLNIFKGSTEDECWKWLGATGNGYGVFKYEYKQHYAHVVSYLIHVAEIPEGQQVLHTCDVRTCCNPKHLFLGTAADNCRDRSSKGRSSKGEENPGAKLSDERVRIIRWKSALGISDKELGKEFNVDPKLIYNIRHNKAWAHVK